MKINNEITLRPRFSIQVKGTRATVLEKFQNQKQRQNEYRISCVDSHIFISLPKEKQHFWSPQLHLEIFDNQPQTEIRGFFGPNPTVWTMFIFFHVVVAVLFMVDLIWLYSDYQLKNPVGFQIGIALGLIGIWILLYIAGRIGKRKGKPDMKNLYEFMEKTIL